MCFSFTHKVWYLKRRHRKRCSPQVTFVMSIFCDSHQSESCCYCCCCPVVLTSDWFLGLELQTGSVNALRPSGTSQSDWHCNYPNASVLKCCKLIYAVAKVHWFHLLQLLLLLRICFSKGATNINRVLI